jgi:hypothetical protein
MLLCSFVLLYAVIVYIILIAQRLLLEVSHLSFFANLLAVLSMELFPCYFGFYVNGLGLLGLQAVELYVSFPNTDVGVSLAMMLLRPSTKVLHRALSMINACSFCVATGFVPNVTSSKCEDRSARRICTLRRVMSESYLAE